MKKGNTMKHIIVFFICSLLLAGPAMATIAYAEDAKSDIIVDGIDLSELSSQARNEIIRMKAKAAEKAKEEAEKAIVETAKENSIVETIKNTDPNKFKEWATGAAAGVRVFCTEIGVSINEFIKTPAGLGICAIILYKYGGSDLIDKIVRLTIRISLFTFNCLVLIFGFRYMYGNKKNIKIVGSGKEAVKTVTKEFRFPSLHGGDADFCMIGGFVALMVLNAAAFGLAIATAI